MGTHFHAAEGLSQDLADFEPQTLQVDWELSLGSLDGHVARMKELNGCFISDREGEDFEHCSLGYFV